MVALPKYVKKRTKRNGRVFVYYEKFRGTPHAWPRIPLPADPFSAEFSLRVEQCGRLLAKKDGDSWTLLAAPMTSAIPRTRISGPRFTQPRRSDENLPPASARPLLR